MLDKPTSELLKTLIDTCGYEYEVLEFKEIIQQLKRKAGVERLKLQLTYLEKMHMISIKYQDEQEICVAPTPTAFAYVDDKNEAIAERSALSASDFEKLRRTCFIGAMLGGAAVMVIVPIIWLVVTLIKSLL